MNSSLEYVFAPTRDYVVHRLARGGVRIIAGGTGLIDRRLRLKEHVLLDVTRMGLERIESRRDGLRIGAAVTLSGLASDSLVQAHAGGLIACTASRAATPALRNMITVGGNIMSGFGWSDLPPVFLVLDAKLGFLSEKGEKEMPLTEFLALSSLERGFCGLLSHVNLPQSSAAVMGAYISIRPQAHGFTQLGIALAARRRKARLEDLRIAVSACVRTPQRLERLEEELPELLPGTSEFQRVVSTAVSSLDVLTTPEISADYARILLLESISEGMTALWKGEKPCN